MRKPFALLCRRVPYYTRTLFRYRQSRVSKKKCDLRRLVQNCTFFVQLSCMMFFQYFLKICNIYWYFNGPKKSANLFSLKIKSSEKQKCVNKLFLSKSDLLKRLNHRISENLQKIRNFQFWYNFTENVFFNGS